jgi:hypothetical protein
MVESFLSEIRKKCLGFNRIDEFWETICMRQTVLSWSDRSRIDALTISSFESFMSVDWIPRAVRNCRSMFVARGPMEVVLDPSVARADHSLMTLSSADNSLAFDTAVHVLLFFRRSAFSPALLLPARFSILCNPDSVDQASAARLRRSSRPHKRFQSGS